LRRLSSTKTLVAPNASRTCSGAAKGAGCPLPQMFFRFVQFWWVERIEVTLLKGDLLRPIDTFFYKRLHNAGNAVSETQKSSFFRGCMTTDHRRIVIWHKCLSYPPPPSGNTTRQNRN
jgi:hypothetical protein